MLIGACNPTLCPIRVIPIHVINQAPASLATLPAVPALPALAWSDPPDDDVATPSRGVAEPARATMTEPAAIVPGPAGGAGSKGDGKTGAEKARQLRHSVLTISRALLSPPPLTPTHTRRVVCAAGRPSDADRCLQPDAMPDSPDVTVL